LRDARPALAGFQPHRAPSGRRLLRVELRKADRRGRGGAARAGRASGGSEAHTRLLRPARHRAGLLAPSRARHAGRGLQLVLRPRVVDRASAELPDREIDGAAHRDPAGPDAPAPVRRAGPARLAAEGRERPRMAHDDSLRADAHRPARVLAPADRVTPALAASGLAPGARVALVHDWLTGMRGGERCLEVLCELFPDAPLFTLLHVPGSVSPTIERRRIVTSFVQRLPRAAERYRYYLPLFPLAIGRFDLAGYDLVASITPSAPHPAPRPPPALHLCCPGVCGGRGGGERAAGARAVARGRPGGRAGPRPGAGTISPGACPGPRRPPRAPPTGAGARAPPRGKFSIGRSTCTASRPR